MADEAEVKGKTVAQLKALLSAHGLPVTGNKPDLVARVLANPHVLDENATKDGTPVAAGSATPAATTGGTSSSAAPTAAASASAPSSTAAAQPAPATNVEDEVEKRKKRAERFGIASTTQDLDKKAEREKRFGAASEQKVKGIDKIDTALKSGTPTKGANGEAKSAPSSPAKAPPANIDPARLAEEEEKKRKRAERFGGASDQSEKKTKIDT